MNGVHRATAIILVTALAACDGNRPSVEAEATTAAASDTMQAFLDGSGLPESKVQTGGAHRSGDPHGKLTAEQLARVALQHFDENRTGLALQTLDEALARFPGDTMLLSLRASINMQNGQTSLALADLNRAIEMNPHDPVLLTNRAQALRQFGRDQDARRDLDGAIEIDDRFVAAYFNRGSLAFEQGHYDLALADFNRCTEIEPAVAAAWFNRASTHEALGDRAQAVSDLQHFLNLELDENWAQMAEEMLAQWQENHS